MKCPHCQSGEINKNGRRQGRQNYICKHCGKQFLDCYKPRGYPLEIRNICINMRKSGMKYREIEKISGISHNTIILWMQQMSSAGESAKQQE